MLGRFSAQLSAPRFQLVLSLFGQCMLCALSHVQLFATPWTVAQQAPLSTEFSRQEYWSGLPFLSPGDLPEPGIKPVSPALKVDSLLLSHQGNINLPYILHLMLNFLNTYFKCLLSIKPCVYIGNIKNYSFANYFVNSSSMFLNVDPNMFW